MPRCRPTAWTTRSSSAPICGSRLASNIRTLPSRWNGLRGPRSGNLDMSFVKGFEMGRVRARLRLGLYNAFNDMLYNDPN